MAARSLNKPAGYTGYSTDDLLPPRGTPESILYNRNLLQQSQQKVQQLRQEVLKESQGKPPSGSGRRSRSTFTDNERSLLNLFINTLIL